MGSRSILALQDELLVEYDLGTAAPIGLVSKVPSGCSLILRDANDQVASAPDGSDVESVTVVNVNSGEIQ